LTVSEISAEKSTTLLRSKRRGDKRLPQVGGDHMINVRQSICDEARQRSTEHMLQCPPTSDEQTQSFTVHWRTTPRWSSGVDRSMTWS